MGPALNVAEVGEVARATLLGHRMTGLTTVARLDVRTPIRVEVLDGPPVALVAAALQTARDAGFTGVSYAPSE